jgi:hypothetical protein
LPLDEPAQVSLGIYVGTVNGGLVSMYGKPVDEARFSFELAHTFLDPSQDLGGRQSNGVAHDQRFATRELAALSALEFIYPTSANTNWEYGGLICQDAGRFVWSPIVTSESQNEVFISDNLCPADAMAARFHTHPPLESPGPSGGDTQNANSYPMLPFYLMAPVEGEPPSPLTRQWFLKYWRDGSRLSQDNICMRVAGTTWLPKTPNSGANCATPSP